MSFQDFGTSSGARGESDSSGSTYAYSTTRVRTGAVRGSVSSQRRGGFDAAGAMRTGGVGMGSSNEPSGAWDQGSVRGQRSLSGRPLGVSGYASGTSSGGGKVSDYLEIYSQNINMLGRLVQQLGTIRDTPELRGQCRCQIDVMKELGGKIQDELKELQRAAEGTSRQEGARIGAMSAKLTKDYNGVKAIAAELEAQAERRMREVDAQRQQQEEADRERANAAFNASEDGRRQGRVLEAQQRRQRVQMQEEAVNTAIIQETEEELQKINKSLYKVNEIYRDLASIVEQQQDDVEHIESNTEAAHARAQEGLAQVQKANEYQPSCTIS